uniref:MHC class II beta chain n=1 Tax=Ditylenchus dipsaci TaxID=166011 RepID=A0A915DSU4_9BILA
MSTCYYMCFASYLVTSWKSVHEQLYDQGDCEGAIPLKPYRFLNDTYLFIEIRDFGQVYFKLENISDVFGPLGELKYFNPETREWSTDILEDFPLTKYNSFVCRPYLRFDRGSINYLEGSSMVKNVIGQLEKMSGCWAGRRWK